jgi:hypothetical protein
MLLPLRVIDEHRLCFSLLRASLPFRYIATVAVFLNSRLPRCMPQPVCGTCIDTRGPLTEHYNIKTSSPH